MRLDKQLFNVSPSDEKKKREKEKKRRHQFLLNIYKEEGQIEYHSPSTHTSSINSIIVYSTGSTNRVKKSSRSVE
jgi:hypothetical protein